MKWGWIHPLSSVRDYFSLPDFGETRLLTLRRKKTFWGTTIVSTIITALLYVASIYNDPEKAKYLLWETILIDYKLRHLWILKLTIP